MQVVETRPAMSSPVEDAMIQTVASGRCCKGFGLITLVGTAYGEAQQVAFCHGRFPFGKCPHRPRGRGANRDPIPLAFCGCPAGRREPCSKSPSGSGDTRGHFATAPPPQAPCPIWLQPGTESGTAQALRSMRGPRGGDRMANLLASASTRGTPCASAWPVDERNAVVSINIDPHRALARRRADGPAPHGRYRPAAALYYNGQFVANRDRQHRDEQQRPLDSQACGQRDPEWGRDATREGSRRSAGPTRASRGRPDAIGANHSPRVVFRRSR